MGGEGITVEREDAFCSHQRWSTWKGEGALPRPPRPLSYRGCKRRPRNLGPSNPGPPPPRPDPRRLPDERLGELRVPAGTAFTGAELRRETSPSSGANSRGLRPARAARWAGARCRSWSGAESGARPRPSARLGLRRRLGSRPLPLPPPPRPAAPPPGSPTNPSLPPAARPPAGLPVSAFVALWLSLSGLTSAGHSPSLPALGLWCHPLLVQGVVISGVCLLSHLLFFTSALSQILSQVF